MDAMTQPRLQSFMLIKILLIKTSHKQHSASMRINICQEFEFP